MTTRAREGGGRLRSYFVAALLLAPEVAWGETAAPPAARAGKPESLPPAEGCGCSITLSPYHAMYPMLLASFEKRIVPRIGLAGDAGIGTFRDGVVGQLGFRLPFYPVGSFDAGLQLGPFARATMHSLPDAYAVGTTEDTSLHRAGDGLYHDAEFARAAARHGVYFGALVGGKYVFPVGNGEKPIRGPTMQLGFLIGYQALFGDTGQEPSPRAARTDSGFLAQLYIEAGWTF